MGSARVDIDEAALAAFYSQNKGLRDGLMGVAQQVASNAAATAGAAEKDGDSRTAGYASAGFRVAWVSRGNKRPHVNIISNASPQVANAVYWHTQRRDGVAHLRAALYRITHRG